MKHLNRFIYYLLLVISITNADIHTLHTTPKIDDKGTIFFVGIFFINKSFIFNKKKAEVINTSAIIKNIVSNSSVFDENLKIESTSKLNKDLVEDKGIFKTFFIKVK
jgi:hypothetical protein